MSLYSYVKTVPRAKKKSVNYLSYLTLTAGICLLFWSFYPIFSFEVYSRLFLSSSTLVPVPKEESKSVTLVSAVLGSTFSNNLRDFTQASLWFPKTSVPNKAEKVDIEEYSLSVPKLNITDAVVKTSGDDLSKSLIHFLPSSLPGHNGNVAIFGHSTLPQLYDVKDYKTIFTYLPSLERGDKVIVKVDEIRYEYEVYEMFVVKPEEVSILEQRYDAPYLTLVTCVPPGTYWNRLVVRARLTAALR